MTSRTRGPVTWLLGAVALLEVPSASASLTGPCTAQVKLGKTTHVLSTTDAITLPREADVHWSVTRPGSGQHLGVGQLQVGVPWPVGQLTVSEWGQPGTPARRSHDSFHYVFTGMVSGVKVPVSFTDTAADGTRCVGAALVDMEGTTPVAWLSLVLTLGAIWNVWTAMRSRQIFQKRHRGDVRGGAIAGVALGFLLALDLLLLGQVRLDSNLPTGLVLGGLLLGWGLAWWAPVGRARLDDGTP